MANFKEVPEVGTRVRVTTDYSKWMKSYPSYVSRTNTYEGVILESDYRDEPGTFRMSGDDIFPERCISLQYVTEIVDVNSLKSVEVESKEDNTVEERVVKGSKGNTYVVRRNGNKYSCTCSGFVFRKSCRHIREAFGD